MSSIIANTANARAFIFGGNATVTLRSAKTGVRYTYRIRQKENEDGTKTPFFVSLLGGPDNESDFYYIGFMHDNSPQLVAGKKGKADSPAFKAFAWMLPYLFSTKAPPMLEIWHEGRCGACNRKLTVPESIESGFGPECIKKQ